MRSHPYANIAVVRKPNSQIEITGEITLEALEKHRPQALKALNERITIDGFRSGHIPEKIIVERMGELSLTEESAAGLVPDIAIHILEHEKIQPIITPNISITKIAHGSPVSFKITVFVMPEIHLPEYRKIGKKVVEREPSEIVVAEKEVDDVILELRRSKAYETLAKKEPNPNGETLNKPPQIKDEDLPLAADAFAKSFGKFTSIAELKAKIKDNLLEEKKVRDKEKRRIEIIEAIMKETGGEMPLPLIERELAIMMARLKDDLTGRGVPFDDYLKRIGKTIEQVEKEWRPDAEKKAKAQLVLAKIASEEKIEPSAADIDHEVSHILEHYKDANRERARDYVRTILTNEKVFQFLETVR